MIPLIEEKDEQRQVLHTGHMDIFECGIRWAVEAKRK